MNDKKAIRGIVIATIILGAYWIYQVGRYMPLIFKKNDPDSIELLQRAGLFGDSFGYISCLFSFFTLLGLIFTLLYQQKEIKKRDEEQRQRDRERHQDKFEEHFFYLYGNFKEVGIQMTPRINDVEKSIKDSFDHIELEGEIVFHVQLTAAIEQRSAWLISYMRLFGMLLNYIDKSRLENRQDYVEILISELGPKRLLIMAAFTVTDYGNQIKPLVEKYGAFRNMYEKQYLFSYLNSRIPNAFFRQTNFLDCPTK